jgi:hypothetical protein
MFTKSHPILKIPNSKFSLLKYEIKAYCRVEEHLQEEVRDKADNGENAEFLNGGHKGEETDGEDGDFSEEILGNVPALAAEALRDADFDIEVRLSRHDRLGEDENVFQANCHHHVREHLLAIQ